MFLIILFTACLFSVFIFGVYIGGKKGYPSIIEDDIWSIKIMITKNHLSFIDFENIKQLLKTPSITADDVSDIHAHFVADPFLINVEGVWHLYFEVMDRRLMKGKIGLATSNDGIDWKYDKIVLDESFHLSYPYVFETIGNLYMIPETYESNSIRLYQSVKSPNEWQFVKTLIEGDQFCDSSILFYNNIWWIFTTTEPRSSNNLRLFYSDTLHGEWMEHPMSPVSHNNPISARPAGRIQIINNNIYRYAQDCEKYYGRAVLQIQINDLTKEIYSESSDSEITRILYPEISKWNHKGMHHFDSHIYKDSQWISAVDGHRNEYYFALRSGDKIRIVERPWLQNIVRFLYTGKPTSHP